MESTRADLTDKLAALENQVSGTVQATTDVVQSTKEAVTDTVEAVTDTVESVKDTVKDTVEAVTDKFSETVGNVTEQVQQTVKSVAETFNLSLQCERHPWAVFGGAVVVGTLGGLLLGGRSRRTHRAERSGADFLPSYSSGSEVKTKDSTEQAQPDKSQASDQADGGVGSWLWEQLGSLKGLAVGTMMGVVRDLVTKSLPESIKERVSEEVDKLTKGLGGEPVKGSILPEEQSDQTEQSKEQSHEHQPPANYGGVGRSETSVGRSGQSSLAGSRY